MSTPTKVRRHSTAEVLILGQDLSASVVAYCGWASVAFLDLRHNELLALKWSPADGFSGQDPAEWLWDRRERLSSRSPARCTLEVLEYVLSGLVRRA